jgi:hypothetical protein
MKWLKKNTGVEYTIKGKPEAKKEYAVSKEDTESNIPVEIQELMLKDFYGEQK